MLRALRNKWGWVGLHLELSGGNDKEKLKTELLIDFLVVINEDLVYFFILSPALKMAPSWNPSMTACFLDWFGALCSSLKYRSLARGPL